MPAPLRLGLVGAGRWGRNYIRTIGSLPGVSLAMLASRNADAAELVPQGCVVESDWQDLVASRALDGLVIATPPRFHAEIALAAIDSGLPVLIEKPMTLDVGEAREVRERSRQRGVLAMVDHTHLFNPAYRALKSILPGFGSIRSIRGEAGNHGPYRPDVPVLWDWGAHDAAMCLDLVDAEPVRLWARVVAQRPDARGLGETVEIEIVFANGVTASLRLSNMSDKRRRLSVVCDEAELEFDDVADRKLTIKAGARQEPVPTQGDMPLRIVVSEFAAAIAAASSRGIGLDLGVRVVELLAACAESCERS